MYDTLLSTILWYASWPILIIVSFMLVRFGLKYFEKRVAKSENTNIPQQK